MDITHNHTSLGYSLTGFTYLRVHGILAMFLFLLFFSLKLFVKCLINTNVVQLFLILAVKYKQTTCKMIYVWTRPHILTYKNV